MNNSTAAATGASNKTIHYFYDDRFANYDYGADHVMQPKRVRYTHSLVCNYGLEDNVKFLPVDRCTAKDMEAYHSSDYIEFLQNVKPATLSTFSQRMIKKYNVQGDCPIFDGVFEYSQIQSGASLQAAAHLIESQADICINWAGGMHHAARTMASGFCYVNDIVLAIMELMKKFKRILYIDIDVHHGDGVEDAFKYTNRVMTVSFHKYGDYFPGTGELSSIGAREGKGYTVNVPLKYGIVDDDYVRCFKTIISKVFEVYQPEVVVMQCGADSLANDKLGQFNLTLRGHGACVKFVRSFDTPLILLGGGGYTVKNVPLCWAYETAIAAGVPISNSLPIHDYYLLYHPKYELRVEEIKDMVNENSKKYLQSITESVLNHLSKLPSAPSVQFHSTPNTSFELEDDDVEIDIDEGNSEPKMAKLLRSGRLVGNDGNEARQQQDTPLAVQPVNEPVPPTKSPRVYTGLNGLRWTLTNAKRIVRPTNHFDSDDEGGHRSAPNPNNKRLAK